MSALSINLSADYYLLTFFAGLGLIQVVAAYSRLWGLLFIPHVPAGYAVGSTMLVAAFTWFVLTGDQNIPGDVGGVEGSEQFGLFFAGTASAVIVTGVLAELAQRRPPPRGPVDGEGFDRLRAMTWLAALADRIRSLGRD